MSHDLGGVGGEGSEIGAKALGVALVTYEWRVPTDDLFDVGGHPSPSSTFAVASDEVGEPSVEGEIHVVPNVQTFGWHPQAIKIGVEATVDNRSAVDKPKPLTNIHRPDRNPHDSAGRRPSLRLEIGM